MQKSRKRRTIPPWRKTVYKPPDAMSEYFKSAEWRALRDQCFKRDDYHCRRCGSGRRRDLTAHHIIPSAESGPNALYNLITLCFPCHNIVEADSLLRTRKLIENSGEFGQEIEVTRVEGEEEIEDSRPDWHRWVYGGQKPP